MRITMPSIRHAAEGSCGQSTLGRLSLRDMSISAALSGPHPTATEYRQVHVAKGVTAPGGVHQQNGPRPATKNTKPFRPWTAGRRRDHESGRGASWYRSDASGCGSWSRSSRRADERGDIVPLVASHDVGASGRLDRGEGAAALGEAAVQRMHHTALARSCAARRGRPSRPGPPACTPRPHLRCLSSPPSNSTECWATSRPVWMTVRRWRSAVSGSASAATSWRPPCSRAPDPSRGSGWRRSPARCTAASGRPVAMPPAATTGTFTASRTSPQQRQQGLIASGSKTCAARSLGTRPGEGARARPGRHRWLRSATTTWGSSRTGGSVGAAGIPGVRGQRRFPARS